MAWWRLIVAGGCLGRESDVAVRFFKLGAVDVGWGFLTSAPEVLVLRGELAWGWVVGVLAG